MFTLHVTSLEGRGIPLIGLNDRLHLVGAVSGVAKSSGASRNRSAIGSVTWSSGAGELTWRMGDAKQFARLEAASPTVRINLVARSTAPQLQQQQLQQDSPSTEVSSSSSSSSEETYIGYILLPLKSLEKRSAMQTVGGFEQWLPIAGAGPGAALRLRACVVETIESSRSLDSSSSSSSSSSGHYLSTSATPLAAGDAHTSSVFIEAPVDDEEQSTRRNGSNSSFSSSATSSSSFRNSGNQEVLQPKETFTDENSDAIAIGNRGDNLFDLNVRIGGVRGLAAALGAQRFPHPTGQLWLSYSLFGVLVQTNAVDGLAELEDECGGGLQQVTDTFTMRSCLPDLSLFLAALQPVQVLLCAPGEVVAQTEISLSQLLQGLPPSVLPKCSNGKPLPFNCPTPIDELDLAEPTSSELASFERTFEGAEMEGEFPLRLSLSSSSSLNNNNNNNNNSSTQSLRSQLATSGTLHAYVSLISRNGGMQGALIPPRGEGSGTGSIAPPRSFINAIHHDQTHKQGEDGKGKGGLQSEAARALESMKDLVAGMIASGRLGDALSNGQHLTATMMPPSQGGGSSNSGSRGADVVDESRRNNAQSRSSSSSFPMMHPQGAHDEETRHSPVNNEREMKKETGPSVQAGLLLLSPIKIQVDEIQIFNKNFEEKAEDSHRHPSSSSRPSGLYLPRRILHVNYESIFTPPASVLSALGVSAEDAGHCIKQDGDLRVCLGENNDADDDDADENNDYNADRGRAAVNALVLHVPSHFQVSPIPHESAVAENHGNGSSQSSSSPSTVLNAGSTSATTASHTTSIPLEPSGIVTFSITIDSYSSGASSSSSSSSTGIEEAATRTSFAHAKIPASALVQAAKMASSNSSSSSLVSVNIVEGRGRDVNVDVDQYKHNSSQVMIIGTILLRISPCDVATEEKDEQQHQTETTTTISDAMKSSTLSPPSPLITTSSTSDSLPRGGTSRVGGAPPVSSSSTTTNHIEGDMHPHDVMVDLSSTVRLLREEVDSERRSCASLRLEVEIERRRADAAEMRQREEVEERARERRGRNEADDECVRLRNRLADAERARDEAERALSLARSEAVGLNTAVAESRSMMHFSSSSSSSSVFQQNESSTSSSLSPPVPPQPAAPVAASILAALQNQILPPQTLDELLRDHPALRLPAEKTLSRLKAEAEASVSEWQRNRESDWIAAKAKAESEWRKEEAEREEKRMVAMEGAWAEREAERQAILVEAQERVREVESRVRKLLSGAEQKMKEAERTKEDAAKMLEGHKQDLAAMQRRVREDGEHVMAQARAREAAVERRVHDAEAEAFRLRETVKMLELQAVEAKKREATSPETGLRDAIAVSTAEVEGMRREVEKKEVERKEMETMRDTALVQVIRLAKEVGRLRDLIEAQRVVDAEKLRVVYLVGEERLALDGDRERLREIRRDVENVRREVDKEVEREEGGGGGRLKVKMRKEADNDDIVEDAVKAEVTAAAESATTESSDLNKASAENGEVIETSSDESSSSSSAIVGGEKNHASMRGTTTESSVEGATTSATVLASTTSSSMSASISASTPASTIMNNGSVAPPGGDSLVRRLKAERKALLDAGAGYSVSHPLVKRIDRALAEASGKLGGGGGI